MIGEVSTMRDLGRVGSDGEFGWWANIGQSELYISQGRTDNQYDNAHQ